MGRLAAIAANKDVGSGMPWGGCDTILADAGVAAVGGA
jgi:hypothetical protein